jgi:hypothetical protein
MKRKWADIKTEASKIKLHFMLSMNKGREKRAVLTEGEGQGRKGRGDGKEEEGRVSQVVECLPSKLKAPISNPSYCH